MSCLVNATAPATSMHFLGPELPNEMFIEIAEHLDDPSLLELSATCHTMHGLVFPVYLERHGLQAVRETTELSLDGKVPQLPTLRAIRWGFRANYLTEVRFELHGGVSTLLEEVSLLISIFENAPRLRSVILHARSLNTWALDAEGRREIAEGFGKQDWLTVYSMLMDAVGRSGCLHLSMPSASNMLKYIQVEGRVVTKGEPKQISQRETCHHAQVVSLMPEPIAETVTVTEPPRKRVSMLKRIWRALTFAKSPKSKLTTEPAASPPPLPLVKTKSPPMTKETSQSNLTEITFDPKTLWIEPFVDWSLSYLHHSSSSLTTLNMLCDDEPTSSEAEIWDSALNQLELPNLCSFSFTGWGFATSGRAISPSAVALFLSRHPTIRSLKLCHIPVPSQLEGSALPDFGSVISRSTPFMPNLTTLTAHPTTIRWLLREMSDHRSSLREITLCTDHPFSFRFEALDECLEDLVNYNLNEARDTKIGFDFSVNGGLYEWFGKHLSLAAAQHGIGSVLQQFTQVRRLKLSCSYRVDLLQAPHIEGFLRWLALFPSITELELKDHPSGCWPRNDEEMKAAARIFCAGLKRVEINHWKVIVIEPASDIVALG